MVCVANRVHLNILVLFCSSVAGDWTKKVEINKLKNIIHIATYTQNAKHAHITTDDYDYSGNRKKEKKMH